MACTLPRVSKDVEVSAQDALHFACFLGALGLWKSVCKPNNLQRARRLKKRESQGERISRP
jgi:hypothetical protein